MAPSTLAIPAYHLLTDGTTTELRVPVVRSKVLRCAVAGLALGQLLSFGFIAAALLLNRGGWAESLLPLAASGVGAWVAGLLALNAWRTHRITWGEGRIDVHNEGPLTRSRFTSRAAGLTAWAVETEPYLFGRKALKLTFWYKGRLDAFWWAKELPSAEAEYLRSLLETQWKAVLR